MTRIPTWECIALDGQRVAHGENFVPGPDYCTACKCEKGEAKFCRAALCQPPQDCRSFRVGESCCDFICLDDILPTRNNNGVPTDTGLRMVASAITAILSLSLLLFLIHRLRQRKLRTAQHQFFEDNIDSIGGPTESCRNNSCCHNAMYLSGNDHVDFFFDGYTPPYSPWKPPSYYFPHREAPPPYSEAVSVDRPTNLPPPGALPSLSPLMAELSSNLQHNDLCHPHNRLSASLRNSVIVSEALSQVRNNNSDINLEEPLGAVANITPPTTILSDQLYDNETFCVENDDTCVNSELYRQLSGESLGDPPPYESVESQGIESNYEIQRRNYDLANRVEGQAEINDEVGCSYTVAKGDNKNTQPSVRLRQRTGSLPVFGQDRTQVPESSQLANISESRATNPDDGTLSMVSTSSGSSVGDIDGLDETTC